MVEAWYAILSLMLAAFAVLDGWNIGAGAVHLLVARTPAERRLVVRALGPLWSWHEVWLIAAGGVLFAAFPAVLAAAFAGFYLALFLVLWSLVLRGMAIEVAGHLDDPLWRAFWDVAFALASALLAVLFGVALGNVVRGVPLGASGEFTLPFFTDLGIHGDVGLVDWYTLSVALFTLAALAAHGASYLALKTEGTVHERSARLARRLWPAALALLVVLTMETSAVRPELFSAMAARPLAGFAVAVAIAGAVAVATGLHARRDARTLAGSCALLAGLLAAFAAGAFPVMLRSTLDPAQSLTAYAGAAGRHGLAGALVWWPAAVLLAVGSFVFNARNFRGKVRLDGGGPQDA